MVIGMIVQAVSKQGGDGKSTSTTATGTAMGSSHGNVAATTTSSAAPPIPKSPSYHSNLDQAGGKEFSFSKASLEDHHSMMIADIEQPAGAPPLNLTNPFAPNHSMGSPLRPRDRNAYSAPPSAVHNLPTLKGCPPQRIYIYPTHYSRNLLIFGRSAGALM